MAMDTSFRLMADMTYLSVGRVEERDEIET